jgi:DNA-directed RNA polymerase specialized sigma24 family protein
VFEKLKEEYDLDDSDVLYLLNKKEVMVPVSVFSKKLGSLETIVKFMKENLGLELNEIAELINRDAKTVWQAYSHAKKKLAAKFVVKSSEYHIPASIIKNRKLSVLENIVVYLHEEHGLKFTEIAKLLERRNTTISTVYARAKIKRGSR